VFSVVASGHLNHSSAKPEQCRHDTKLVLLGFFHASGLGVTTLTWSILNGEKSALFRGFPVPLKSE
jgi:hypothetical protein